LDLSLGLFAGEDIPCGSLVGVYLGKYYTSNSQELEEGHYLFNIGKCGGRMKYMIDAKNHGNVRLLHLLLHQLSFILT
jgi:hypothetical protein